MDLNELSVYFHLWPLGAAPRLQCTAAGREEERMNNIRLLFGRCPRDGGRGRRAVTELHSRGLLLLLRVSNGLFGRRKQQEPAGGCSAREETSRQPRGLWRAAAEQRQEEERSSGSAPCRPSDSGTDSFQVPTHSSSRMARASCSLWFFELRTESSQLVSQQNPGNSPGTYVTVSLCDCVMSGGVTLAQEAPKFIQVCLCVNRSQQWTWSLR